MFEEHKHYTVGELIFIANSFIVEGTNLSEVTRQLDEVTGEKHKQAGINVFVQKLRERAANYVEIMEYTNQETLVFAGEHAIIDESVLFTTKDGPTWVVGVKNSETEKYMLWPIADRKAKTIFEAIKRVIQPGAIICTDGYSGYGKIAEKLEAQEHKAFRHNRRSFGTGIESTSKIEGVWGTIKTYIKKRYNQVPTTKTLQFIREAEFRQKYISQVQNGRLEAFLKLIHY